MDEKQKIREELQELQSTRLLGYQGQKANWEVPEGYLDDLTDRVLAQQQATGPRIRRQFVLRWAAAAAVALVAGYWWWSVTTAPPAIAQAAVDWNQIPTEELQQYVSDNIDEFDLELLAETVAQTSEQPQQQQAQSANGISIEAMEEFLEADDEWLEDLETEDWF